jgi:hypothetical protein
VGKEAPLPGLVPWRKKQRELPVRFDSSRNGSWGIAELSVLAGQFPQQQYYGKDKLLHKSGDIQHGKFRLEVGQQERTIVDAWLSFVGIDRFV